MCFYKLFRFFCGVIVLSMTIAVPPFARFIEASDIVIDASHELVNAPALLSSSIWVMDLFSKEPPYMLDKFFEDNRPRIIQFSLRAALARSENFEAFKKSLKKDLEGPSAGLLLKKVKSQNVLLIVGYDPCPMPKWLSSAPGDDRRFRSGAGSFTAQECAPPRDYKMWAEVCKYTMQHLKSLGINNLGLYVGHEQDLDWYGSEESFFKYYEEAARSVKSLDKNIMVGGAGTIGWNSKRQGCSSPVYSKAGAQLCSGIKGWKKSNNRTFLQNFIGYAAKNDVPVDFINWHSFGVVPELFPEIAGHLRDWTKEGGLKNVKLYPSDWTYWTRIYPADYLDTTETAAYYVKALYYMWAAGIEWQGHDFNVFNDGLEKAVIGARKNSTFIGDWSIFTRAGRSGGGIIKPVYNAMKALTLLTGGHESGRKLIASTIPSSGSLKAISTISDDRKNISVILTNAVSGHLNWTPYLLDLTESRSDLKEETRALKNCMEENRGTKKAAEAIQKCGEKLLASEKNPMKAEAVNYIQQAYRCINNKTKSNCLKDLSKQLKYPENVKFAEKLASTAEVSVAAQPVTLSFGNMPFSGKALLSIYRIDDSNSNACSFNKRTEPKPSNVACGMGGAIDRAVQEAKERAHNDASNAAAGHLSSIGYPREIIDFLKSVASKCRANKGPKQCINNEIENYPHQKDYNAEKIKADLKEAVLQYLASFELSYYKGIDNINNKKEVSLEGSKSEKQVAVTDKRFKFSFEMEPDSVWLVTLIKEGK